MGSLGGTWEEGRAGRTVFFWSEAPGGMLGSWLPRLESSVALGERQMLFCFQQNTHSDGNRDKPCFFQPKAGMLSAPDCAQPPVPTSACALRRLTSFQACGGESPVAQGSAAAAAANGQGQRMGEVWKMCGGQKFWFLNFPCFLCVLVLLAIFPRQTHGSLFSTLSKLPPYNPCTFPTACRPLN